MFAPAPFVSTESSPPSPGIPTVITGRDLVMNDSSSSDSEMTHPNTPAGAHDLPASPPSTPPLSGFNKEYQSFVYQQGLSGEMQQRSSGSILEQRRLSHPDAQSQMDRILLNVTPTSTDRPFTPANLLPSHMQRTAPRPSSSSSSRVPLVRQATHTVTFSDDDLDETPTTPKGHPLRSGFSKYVDIERHIKGVESQRNKLIGFLGGRGSGLAPGVRGSGSELARGKVFRPESPNVPTSDSYMTTVEKLRKTATHFARIPRKYRPVLAIMLCGLLCFTMVARSHSREMESQRMISKRYSSGLQKAFVIGEGSLDVARHTTFQLSPDEMDHARDATTLDAMRAVDISQETLAQPEEVEQTRQVPQPFRTAANGEQPYEFSFESKQEEMAALVSFLTSTSSNALPAVDPALPLDPQLVLDFDYTKAATARADMQQLTEDVFALFPVIVVGRMRDPQHRELLRIMSLYTSSPPPLVIEVDQRKDVDTLVPLLGRLLDTDVMPQIIVNGVAAADHAKLTALQGSGDVKEYFEALGVVLHDKKMKKKPKYIKDAERREKERILGPKPIAVGGKAAN